MAYRTQNSPPRLKGKGSKLSAKMQTFADEYLVDLNASKAVVRALYKTNNPNRLGPELLRHPLIIEYLDEKMKKRRDRMEIKADYLVEKLLKIIENCEEDNPQAALRAIELAGKSIALWKDRQEISGPDGGAIEMEQRVKEDVADLKSKLDRLSESTGTRGSSVVPITAGSRKS